MLIQHLALSDKINEFLALLARDIKDDLLEKKLWWHDELNRINPTIISRRKYTYVYVYSTPRYVIDNTTEVIFPVRLSKRVGRIMYRKNKIPKIDFTPNFSVCTLDGMYMYFWGGFRPVERV